MDDLSLDDILPIFYRRRKIFALTFTLIFLATFAYALHWSRYRATATVQIEQPAIAANVANVGTTDSGTQELGLADRRIAQIEQRVTSTESLAAIIEKLNLYPAINHKLPATKLARIMRSKIRLELIGSSIANPAAAQKESVEQLSAIAFNLSFDYNDPELAKRALDTIVERFIDEDAAQRRSQSEQTATFLDGELKTLEAAIKDQEAKAAAFRAQFGESGPSAVLFNQQASLTNSVNLQNIDNQISAAQATVSGLRTQLQGTSPYSTMSEDGRQIMSAGSQLHNLESQYASLSTRYGAEHPDVIKVQQQIAALKTSGNVKAGRKTQDADNPAYLQLNAQLTAAQAQLSALTGQRASLAAQQEKFNAALAKNPMIEQQMSQITLDLDNAKERYRALKDKKLASEMSAKLESGSNGERLKIINPSILPESTSPKRLYLILGGLILAWVSAVSMVILVEILSQSVRGARHLTSIVGMAPLVTIPHIADHGGAHG